MQQKMADKLYDFKQMEMDQRARDLQKAEEECRRAINSAVKDYNDALVIYVQKNRDFNFKVFYLLKHKETRTRTKDCHKKNARAR